MSQLTAIVASMCLNLSQPFEIKQTCIDYWVNCAYDISKVQQCKDKEPKWTTNKLRPSTETR